MKKISIRLTVMSLFFFLAFMVLTVVYIAHYNSVEKISQKSVIEHFNMVSKNINQQFKDIDRYFMMHVNIFTFDLEDKKISDILADNKKRLKMYSSFLEEYNNIYSIYIGTKHNDFFEIINLDVNKKAREKYNAKKSDKWLTIGIKNGEKFKTIKLLDKNLNQTAIKQIKTTYQVDKRTWYKLGLKANGKVAITKPYIYESIAVEGISYVKKFNDNMVFSIGLLVQDINKMLINKQYSSFFSSFVVDKNKKIIARSSKETKQFLSILKDTNLSKINSLHGIKTINGKKYPYNITKLKNGYVISIADLDAISNFHEGTLTKIELFAFIVSIILLPIVWYLSSFIVKPILLLSKENKKIASREFGKINKINSRISEISELSNSLYDMATSIKGHQSTLEQKVQERTKELKKLSVTDKLTGIYNRIKIDESLDIELSRSKRYGTNFGIIIMDIDFFKNVNDKFGHQIGDKVLQNFAQILKCGIRDTDIVGRWGGEEFIIICTNITLDNLVKLAEKLRTCIENYKFNNEIHKTASFGVALHQKNEKIEQLINRADGALYKAKENGRNQVAQG